MIKYDAKRFDKHFVNLRRLPTFKHQLALQALFFALVLTVLFLISDTPQFADITALAALVSYYFYRKWKKELDADLESENKKAK